MEWKKVEEFEKDSYEKELLLLFSETHNVISLGYYDLKKSEWVMTAFDGSSCYYRRVTHYCKIPPLPIQE